MVGEFSYRNEVILAGQVSAPPAYSHTNHGERFYKFTLRVLRLSRCADELVILAGETLLRAFEVCADRRVRITGELRSYNNRSGRGSRLVHRGAGAHDGGRDAVGGVQLVSRWRACCASGRCCRSTPLGREICDVMLAVNRRYGRADYIPCIAWGALAERIGLLNVGDRLSFEGRIQSRTYRKMTEQGAQERVAYEVSVMNPLDAWEDGNCIFSSTV